MANDTRCSLGHFGQARLPSDGVEEAGKDEVEAVEEEPGVAEKAAKAEPSTGGAAAAAGKQSVRGTASRPRAGKGSTKGRALSSGKYARVQPAAAAAAAAAAAPAVRPTTVPAALVAVPAGATSQSTAAPPCARFVCHLCFQPSEAQKPWMIGKQRPDQCHVPHQVAVEFTATDEELMALYAPTGGRVADRAHRLLLRGAMHSLNPEASAIAISPQLCNRSALGVSGSNNFDCRKRAGTSPLYARRLWKDRSIVSRATENGPACVNTSCVQTSTQRSAGALSCAPWLPRPCAGCRQRLGAARRCLSTRKVRARSSVP